MKLAILTRNKSFYGLNLLNAFSKNGIALCGVIVVQHTLREKMELFNSVRRRIGLGDTLYYAMEMMIKDFKNKNRYRTKKRYLFTFDYRKLAENIFYSRGTNSLDTIRVLEFLKPDILILGQSGIVNKKILDIPRLGVLNIHPGILPLYRGVDVHLWALYYKDFDNIGYTIHWANSGVDTGNIIERRFYIFRGDETIDNLEERIVNESLCGALSVVNNLIQCCSKGEEQDIKAGRLYYKIPLRYKNISKMHLQEFLSRRFPNKKN